MGKATVIEDFQVLRIWASVFDAGNCRLQSYRIDFDFRSCDAKYAANKSPHRFQSGLVTNR